MQYRLVGTVHRRCGAMNAILQQSAWLSSGTDRSGSRVWSEGFASTSHIQHRELTCCLQFDSNFFLPHYHPTFLQQWPVERLFGRQPGRVMVTDTGDPKHCLDAASEDIRGADGLVFVYDITSQQSLSSIQDIFEDVRKALPSSLTFGVSARSPYFDIGQDVRYPPALLLGNKGDLLREGETYDGRGAQMAKENGWRYGEVSAKMDVACESISAFATELFEYEHKKRKAFRDRTCGLNQMCIVM